MAIPQRSTCVGIDINEIRPGAKAQLEDVVTLVKDQAFVYETLTGVKVPDSTTIAATPHVHDGTTGAIRRRPLVQSWPDAILNPRDLTWAGSNSGAWEPWHMVPFFAPAGVSSVKVWMVVSPLTLGMLDTIRARSYDSSFASISYAAQPWRIADAGHWLESGTGGYSVAYLDLTVNAGALNVIALEAWDGYSKPGTGADEETGTIIPAGSRVVYGWGAGPIQQPFAGAMQYRDPGGSASYDMTVPSDFQTYDEAVLGTDAAFSSFVATKAAKNNGVLQEILTDKAAGLNAASARVIRGHPHGDNGTSNIEEAGAAIDMCLGAWAYGTLRPPVDGGTVGAYTAVHTADTSTNAWSGRIIAPVLAATTSEGFVGRHPFRLPISNDVNLGISAGTTKLKAAAIVYKDDTVSTDFKFTVYDAEAGNAGTTATATSTTAGLQIVTVSDLEASATATGGGDRQTLQTTMTRSAAKAASVAMLGACIYFEA